MLTQMQSILFIVPIIEILLLYFLSRIVFSQLARFLQTIIAKAKWIYYSLAFLFLPGTYVHELSHYLMAKILLVPVYGFSLRPQIIGHELHLGHVEVARTDFLRRFLVGVAPIVFGVATILGSIYLLILFEKTHDIFFIILEAILVFEVGNTMFMSKKDMEGSWKIWIVLIVIGALFTYLGFQVDPVMHILSGNSELFKHISYYLALPIGIDILLITIIKIIISLSRI